MERECEFIDVKNDLGTWTVPTLFAPQQVGGDNPKVAGVIGLTAVGETHSTHIIQAMLLSTWLKRDVVSSQNDKALFIDAGAHIGTVTVAVAQSLTENSIKSKHYSIELLPEIYFCLQRNVSNNNISAEVKTVNAALTSPEIAESIKSMYVPSLCGDWDFNTQSSTAGCFTYSEKDLDIESNQVPTTTIDTLLKDETLSVTAIKVDCEGSDLDVLKGAVKTIKRSRPIILFEDTNRSQTVFLVDKEKTKNDGRFFIRGQNLLNNEIVSFFEELDYKVIKNWLYTSWNEFIAIPIEYIDVMYEEGRSLCDYLPEDNFAEYWTWLGDDHKKDPKNVQLANILFSIFESWGKEQTVLWFENNKELATIDEFYCYTEELLKC